MQHLQCLLHLQRTDFEPAGINESFKCSILLNCFYNVTPIFPKQTPLFPEGNSAFKLNFPQNPTTFSNLDTLSLSKSDLLKREFIPSQFKEDFPLFSLAQSASLPFMTKPTPQLPNQACLPI